MIEQIVFKIEPLFDPFILCKTNVNVMMRNHLHTVTLLSNHAVAIF